MTVANRPVLGIAVCPFCKAGNSVIWNGNFKYPCGSCRKELKVKRQKLKHAQAVKLKGE